MGYILGRVQILFCFVLMFLTLFGLGRLMGGRAYMPLKIPRKKTVCTPKVLTHIGLHKNFKSLSLKTKKMAAVIKSTVFGRSVHCGQIIKRKAGGPSQNWLTFCLEYLNLAQMYLN